MTLGKEGIPEASQNAVLNANYMMNKLKDLYTMEYDEVCMHEFVMSLEDLKKKAGVSAMDIAKGLLDNGIHPPTMYFPLIVHEALMVEPTETESKKYWIMQLRYFVSFTMTHLRIRKACFRHR